MRRYLRLTRMFLAQTVKANMGSKVDFFIGFISHFLLQSIGLLFLFLVFQQIPELNGWSFEQMLFIYGYAQIPRGLDFIVSNFLWGFARHTVRYGVFDQFLTRPLGTLYQVLVQRISLDGLGEVAVGVGCVAYAMAAMEMKVSIGFVLAFIYAVLVGAVIFFAVKLFFASTAFFTKNAYSLLYFVQNLYDYAKYPMEIFAKPIRVVLSYVLPFAFVAFTPASYFLGHESLVYALGGGTIAAAITIAIALWFYGKGVRRYESAGS